MADWRQMIDKQLAKGFHEKPYKPEDGRTKLIAIIDQAAKQHEEGDVTSKRRAWAVGGNDGISFQAVLNGNVIPLDGDPLPYVHKTQFQDFLKSLKASVEKGELDKEIREALTKPRGEGKAASGSKASSTATVQRSADSNLRSAMSAKGRYGKNPDGSAMTDAQKAAFANDRSLDEKLMTAEQKAAYADRNTKPRASRSKS